MGRRRAAIYLRISLDQTGEGLAIARQRKDCQAIIAARGWDVAGEYVDSSISASDARKNRPEYDRLVRDYRGGLFDALVCYDLDRLTRQPRQMEDWIDAADGHGLALVTANGEADLTTDAGRMFARVKLAVARGEVERKSARQKAAARQRATLGRPPLGVRLTGYTPKGDVVAGEAELVRRVFAMFAAGESLKGIARTLNDEGMRTRHGHPWNPSTVRGILANPRYAGRAVYQGLEVGPGGWEPLVSDDEYRLVKSRLDDPRRATNRVGTDRRHLGSGLYLCAVCDRPVSGWSGARYRCRDAHVNRARGPVDDFVRAAITERLQRPDIADLLAPSEAEMRPLLDTVRAARARVERVGADYDADLIDGARYAVAIEKARAELATAERRLASVSSPAAALLAGPDPAGAFRVGSLMTQRAIVEAVAVVRLQRGVRFSREFRGDTVQIEWR